MYVATQIEPVSVLSFVWMAGEKVPPSPFLDFLFDSEWALGATTTSHGYACRALPCDADIYTV